MASARPLPIHGPLPAPFEPTLCQALPSKTATMSARGSPFAFWNDPATKTREPEAVSP